jgi:hypothetical protein
MTCVNMPGTVPRLFREQRLEAAYGGIRLHVRELGICSKALASLVIG